jgi:uncharacterized protein
MDLFTFLILVLAGIGAGVITGLVGASAVMVMAPLLIVVLKMDPYIAIGLSLCTDVVASLVAARIYYKNKNINLYPTLPILLSAFIGVTLGSYLSLSLPQANLSGLTGLGIVAIGLGLILKKEKKKKKERSKFIVRLTESKRKRVVFLSLIGLLIGLNSGAFGAGGGMMLLAALVFILGFELHVAIGTSILIMVFLAFFGSVTHFYYQPFSLLYLLIASVGAFFGARYSSIIANLTSERKLKFIAGIIFLTLGLLLAIKSFFLIGI